MIKLSGYKILKKIGSGGMGDIYLAEHEKLEKKVAIKSLHKNLATDPSFRERFSQEAKTHSKLDHPNIVKLLDYKERKDGLFLVMEYVDGKQLDEHIKKVTGPIPEEELTALFSQILDAFGYAHKIGLVHRDIKPSNIMIDKEGRIKVLDFGIAKMQEEEKGLTKTGVQIGTAAYMSPEQVNAKKVDKLTDIYSLGVTLYYMAVGKSPYDGETNTFSIQTKIVSESFPIARESYPGVSVRLEEIIKKATQKNKKYRYQNCENFRKDLNSEKVVVTEVLESSAKKEVVKKVMNIKKAYIIMFILGWPLIYIILHFFVGFEDFDIEQMFEFYELGFPILFHFLGLLPVFLFNKYRLGLLAIKWKKAYIIMFILGWPLTYIIVNLFEGFEYFDIEQMFELYEEGIPILFHFLGLVPVFLFHFFKERSIIDKTGKVLDQLKKLNDLKKEGVISKAEFERLSKELKRDF